MQEREKWWLAECLALAAGFGMQTGALVEAKRKLAMERSKFDWPARPEPLGLQEVNAPKFHASTRSTIPEAFWGEFAEDVHDCGGDSSMLVSQRRIMVSETDRKDIDQVMWKAPDRLEIDALDQSYAHVSFGMELSGDRDEITFVYTNMKRVFQRCSTRAHSEPPVLKSLENGGWSDETMADDANLTMNADEISE